MTNCGNCGAAAKPDEIVCRYCGSRLASVGCPWCFGMIPIGANHCPHCGTAWQQVERLADVEMECPRCSAHLRAIEVGGVPIRECSGCGGIWADAAAFRSICERATRPEPALGVPALAAGRSTGTPLETVRYIKCPRCRKLMNRMNFARCSGVIVDLCPDHGSWFDRDELRRIVQFLQNGGLDAARARTARTQAETRRIDAPSHAVEGRPGYLRSGEEVLPALGAAGELITWFVSEAFRSR